MGQVDKITFARNEYEIQVGSEDYFKYGNYVMVLASVDKENLPALTLEERQKNLNQLISRGFRVRLASNMLTGQAYLQGDYLDPNRFPVPEVPWKSRHFYVPSAPGEFATIKQSVDQILNRLEKIDTQKISQAIEEVFVALKEAIRDANVPEVTAQLNRTLQQIDKLIISGKPEIEESLENLREVSANLKDLTETLKQHPSALIFSKPPPKSEALK